MSNPSGPDEPDRVTAEEAHGGDEPTAEPATEAIESAGAEHEPETEIFSSAQPTGQSEEQEPERRFTAPSGFDAGSTQKISTTDEPATEAFAPQKLVAPQMIPPRGDPPKPPPNRRRWGWVIALVLVIAALVAVAVLGTLLLTQAREPKMSQEDQVRSTIKDFDIAIQNGDLTTLRNITCGATHDSYVKYDDKSWKETHDRVAAAKQYPVVASIDQVVVNGEHAEANVTTFMAYAPQTRSTRSFDLQMRDEQWKICLAPQ
jgi:hypothetical protein